MNVIMCVIVCVCVIVYVAVWEKSELTWFHPDLLLS